MAEKARKCDGKCMDCGMYQRQFCSAQLAYNNMKQMEILSAEINRLSEKIESIQNTEADIFDPIHAQYGDGAEE